jgi:hypothetical protein
LDNKAREDVEFKDAYEEERLLEEQKTQQEKERCLKELTMVKSVLFDQQIEVDEINSTSEQILL